jgi:hypothetical protein
MWAWTATNVQAPCGSTSIVFSASDISQATLYSQTGTNNRIMCYAPVASGRPGSWIWAVSGPGAAGSVPITAGSEADFTGNCAQNLPREMICAPPVHVAYYIDNVADGIGMGTPALPVLYYVPDVFTVQLAGGFPSASDIPIALGIEDMQFEVCEGGSGVTGTDCELDASWTAGYDASGLTTEWKNLTAVRIHMVARTLRQDYKRTAVSTPLDLDPNDTQFLSNPTADGYHRRVATTEVLVRNAVGTWQILNSGW